MNFTKRTSFARYGKVKGAKGRARSPAVGDPASSPRLEPTAFWNDVPLFQPPTTAWPTLNTAASPPFRARRARSPAVGDPASSPRLEPTAFWNDVPLFQPPTTAWPTLNTAASPPFRTVMKPFTPYGTDPSTIAVS